MAKTPHSAASSYCSAAEFLKRCDVRSVRRLCSDTDAPIDEAAIATNVNLLAALDDASGDVEAAALVGERYTKDDLAALTGVALAKLRRIISGLAIFYLMERRPAVLEKAPASVTLAFEWLDQLAQGTRIFGFVETMDAGHLDHDVETSDDVVERNLPSYIARQMFGTRANRMVGE